MSWSTVRPVSTYSGGSSRATLVLIGYVLLYTAMMTISPKKLDRYLMPAYPALVILAAIAIESAFRTVLTGRRLWFGILGVAAVQAAFIISVQPYSLSFYNPLLGGAPMASRAMIVGWGEGLDQVAAYLEALPDAQDVVVASLYRDGVMPLIRGRGVRLPAWQEANYFVNYINMDQRGLVPVGLQRLVDELPPDFAVRLTGLEYVRVYRIPPEVRDESGTLPGPRPNPVPRP